jgi:hypothetical protein
MRLVAALAQRLEQSARWNRNRRRTDGRLSSFPQAVDAGAEQKWRTGNATKRGDPAGGYAGVPTEFLQHTRVSNGGLAVSRKTLRFAEEIA